MIPEEIVQRERGEKIRMIQEIWVPCFFDKDYLVSNLGMVKRVSKRHKSSGNLLGILWLIPTVGTKGYWTVAIDGKTYKLHQVVYYSFFPSEYVWNRRDKCVDHINGIKEDCRLVNLKLIAWEANSDKGKKDHSKGLF